MNKGQYISNEGLEEREREREREREYLYLYFEAMNKLETPVTRVEDKHQHRRTWLHSYILDSCNFQECLKSLTNNKAPGPDGIVNELLKAIPLEYHQTIHKLLIIMWATGITQED
jgi:hypothetical protein